MTSASFSCLQSLPWLRISIHPGSHLESRLAALKYELPVWKPADIGADPEKLGLNGSPTRVVKTQPPDPRQADTIRIEGTPKECARALVHELRLRSLI